MGKRSFDPEPYLPLTPAMLQVLVALADGEKHGYAIIKEVHRRTDGKVRLSAGTLYALIKRFVQDGLIIECDERPDPALDDERRRYYRLSDTGRAVALAEEKKIRLDRLPLENLQSIHPGITADVFSVLAVQSSVKSRTSFGGTAPSEVRKQIRYWKKHIAKA
jgi:DNA-binding PadR family transcriptional regulator